MNNQTDNFNEIINEAKAGTLAGGFTNPFSGLVGNFKYRWFDDEPQYESLYTEAHDEAPIDKHKPINKGVDIFV
ncbi:hypothetical protein [sulfur-oxidizing endosymbiont of Gigantopelta aegis]|uniref:hypothetical protein n=1 Tax=sulfur-oxidizing endosymbiont of Gigantopelta aegis TaxID=2794934 RepID=UPI0018DCB6FE|nr:hypothetical protein [sulfur-oxidizing endosymbiont of Gigantopelta aegis]